MILKLELLADVSRAQRALAAASADLSAFGGDAGKSSTKFDAAMGDMEVSLKALADEANKDFARVEEDARKAAAGVGDAAAGMGGAAGTFGGAMGKMGESAKGFGITTAAVFAGTALLEGVKALGTAMVDIFSDALDQEVSTDRLQASLGTTPALAERYGRLAGESYAGAYGDSIGELKDTTAAVVRSLGDLGDEGIKSAAQQAHNLATVFDVDVLASVRGVAALVKNGLAPNFDAAADVITRGFQGSANLADDFLDTLTEYSPLMKGIGLDAAQFTGILTQGMDAGARNTDVQADALKEFGIIAKEAGAEAPAALAAAMAGVADAQQGYEDAVRGVASASQGVADAQQGYQDALRGVAQAERGVIDAQQSYQDSLGAVDDAVQAVADAQQGYQDSLDGVADAELGVVDAQQTYQDSLDAVADAEARHVESVRSVTDAQRDLAAAEAELAEARAGRSEGDALSVEGARLSLLRAQERATKAASGKGASLLDQQEAALGVRRADLALRDAEAKAAGRVAEAEGKVTDARETLADAQDGVADSSKAVRDAHRGVDAAARGVVDAEDAVRDAHRGVEAAARGIASAEDGVSAAHRGVDAAARGVTDAQEGVRDAHRGVEAASRGIITAQDGVRDAHRGVEAAARDVATAEAAANKEREKGWLATLGLQGALDLLRNTKDPLEKNRLGVALFGTLYEDLGPIIDAWDPSSAVAKLGQVTGAAKEMDTVVGDNSKTTWEKFQRGVSTGLLNFVDAEVMPRLEGFKSWVTTSLAPLWDDVTKAWGSLETWWNESAKPVLAEIYTWFSEKWNEIWPKAVQLMDDFKKAWPEIKETILDVYDNAIKPVITFISENSEMFKNLGIVIGIIAGVFLLLAGAMVGGAIIFGVIFVAISGLMALITTVALVVIMRFANIWWDVFNNLKDVASAIFSKFTTIVEDVVGFVQRVGEVASGMWNFLSEQLSKVKDWIGDRVGEIVGFFLGLPARISALASGLWNFLSEQIISVKNSIADRVNEIVGFFVGMPGRIGEAVGGAFDGIKGAMRSVLVWVAEKWNDTIGSLRFDVPDWIPGIGGRGFDFPRIPVPIPALAAGGIITKPTFLLAGEAGPEAIIPLSKMGSTAAPVYNISVSTSGLGADNPSVARDVVAAIRSYERRNGPLYPTAAASTAAGGGDTSGPVGYAGDLGDGAATVFAVPHGLGTRDVVAEVYEIATGITVPVDVVRLDADTIEVTFTEAPAYGSMRCTVLPAGVLV